MNLPYNAMLLQILRIANYPGNRESLVTQFQQMNYSETLCNIIEKLPQDQQEKIKSVKTIKELLTKYIDPDIYKVEFEHVAQKALNEFVNSISDTLNEIQKKQITAVLKID